MSDRICAVGGCDRELIPPHGRGMCSMHSVLCAVVDHKRPVSRGGEHSRANAQAAHNGCNIRKSNKVLEAAK